MIRLVMVLLMLMLMLIQLTACSKTAIPTDPGTTILQSEASGSGVPYARESTCSTSTTNSNTEGETEESEENSVAEDEADWPNPEPAPQENYFVTGKLYDSALVEWIGDEVWEEWMKENPEGTVYDLFRDFNINDEQLKTIVSDYVYEEYIKYRP